MSQTFETGFTTTLAQKLNSTDTTAVVAQAPTVTKGRFFLKSGNTKAWIKFTGVSGTTLTGVTFVSQTADPSTTVSGQTFVAGTVLKLVAMHDQLSDKQEGLPVKVYASSAARDADITSPSNGMSVYLTDAGSFYDYVAGVWTARANGTNVNASPTVAGRVEIGTQTQVDTPTDTGETGAYNVVIPSTFQAGITARIATETQAETGTSNTVLMTPLSARQADNVIVLVAGENLTAGNAVYVKLSDSKAYKSDANVNNATEFVGFVLNTVSTDGSALVKTAGIFTTTGLTANSDYFLSDTAGAIAATAGTNVYRVGTAISTTQLVIDTKTIVPADLTIASATATDSIAGSGGVYTKYKEMVAPNSGTFITITTATNVDGGGGGDVNFRVYKNGVAYGTEQTIIGGAGSLTFTENLFFLKGDLIQLYAKATNASAHTVSLLRIQGLFVTPQYALINDN